jgi:hypothetical protein
LAAPEVGSVSDSAELVIRKRFVGAHSCGPPGAVGLATLSFLGTSEAETCSLVAHALALVHLVLSWNCLPV